MGGKTSKSTQAITVPPEVLARYNAVNTRADTVTNRPYQYYTGQFVAPLTATQQSGIANTNAAAGMAQPYYGAATGQLMGAQQAASPYYQGATQQLAQGINAGNQFANQSSGSLNNAQNVGNQLAGQSYGAINQAQGVGSDLAGQSYGAINQAQGVGNQFANQSSGTLGNAQNVGNQLAAQSYGSLNDAQGIGNQLAAQSYGTLGGAQDVGNQLAGQSYGALGEAQGIGSQLAGQSLGTINAAQQQAAGIQQGALGGLGAAYSGAQPYNQAAGGLYQQGLEQGQNLTGQSSYGTQQALAGAQPYQGAATQYMGAGAQAVNPNELGADQINKYLSPYLSTVLQGTAGLLNQQNQQQQAGQMGNAIRSGAFGGDRSGIAAANLNQQQNLANSKIYSDILNQGFGQALGTAQQQQQLGLGAAQANRAAQQQASQQALAIGQQGFGQGLSAAQQQAALGQQLFGMGSTTGQNAAALGQQIYNQGTGTAQQQAALAQQMFGQGATTAAQQAALGQQQFGQGATAAQQLASLGQQQFGQGATAAQQQAALGQQQFGQGATVAQQQAALGQQQFGQGATAAQQQAALGQQQFGQGAATSQQLASLGQQQFGQGATTAQQLASLGQQQFGQGATTAAQQAALGQQQFGQGTAASQQAAALGQGIYGMGANTSAQLAGLGAGAQGAALSGAGAQLAAGQAEQATQQAENTAKYNEFLQAQSLPYQQLKLASDIALGTGTASGSTTTTAQPGGFFSDERLKENIKSVGKTFDGQTIHSFNYKGDPRTQIGLIAQEVQKHHPEAVGLAGGYKTVNYDKATEDAADRGHMASGGLASAGGSVMPYNAGQGFAGGGDVGFDPAIMQQMLAAQQAMYAPLSSGGMYAGGPNAGGGLVPQSEFAAGQLMTPAELPRRPTGAEQAKTIVDLGKSVNDFGEGVGAWGGDDKKPEAKKDNKPYKDIEDEILNRALGGGIPYSGQGLDIPESGLAAGSGSPMTASALQAQQSGIQKLGDTADTGMKLFKAGKKLSKLFADGGGVPYGGQGLDIPDEEESSKTYQLPTAGDMPDKPKSGFSKAVKVAGTVAKIASMFSDKRMKENIKPIGKMFDGQIVHSFNYKGDPRTQIGLIAQEVEGHKPHAVGSAGKYKTVDYAKATSGAAKRGHFAMGGEPVAGLMGAEMNSLDEGDREPDFNLDPEDFLSGGDPDTEFFMRDSFKKPESPAQAAGLGALEDKSAQVLDAYKPKNPFKPRPTGLAPAAVSLPKDLSQIGKLIFAAEGDGQAKTSSALGRYGIIKGTYVDYFKKAFPERARQLGDAGIRALRTTPEGRKLNEQFGPMIIADNAKSLSKAGLPTNAGTVYLAHFLGPAGAVRALSVSPDTPIQKAVDKDAIDANYDVFVKRNIRTTGDLLNWSNSTMAKRAKELGRASGGLAGRDGYQDGGVPKTEKELEEELAATIPTETIIPEPPRRKEGGLGAAAPVATPAALPATTPTALAAAEKPVVEDIVVTAKPDPRGKPQTAPRQTIYGRGKQDPISYEGGKIPSFAYDYMSEPFFKGIKRGSAGSIIPLLTGIAAMGTAPTRSLGVALATGLGAGAQSYQNLGNERNKQLVQRQVGTARYADSVRAYFDKEFIPLGNGEYYYRGKKINQDQYNQMYKDAVTNQTGDLIPSIPEAAMPYQTAKAPEAKPVAIRDKPDMSTPQGIYAAAYADDVVQDARNRAANLKADIARDRTLQADPQMQTNPTSFTALNSRIAASQTALTEATAAMTDRLSQLTGVPLANLSEAQRTVFDQTMQKATVLEEQKQAMRPILQQFNALKDDFQGGTAQGAWAKITDFVKNFGNLTEDQKALIGSGADANSRQQIMQTIGGPVFDPNNPGPALLWIRDNYIKPRYLDIEAQVNSIKPFTQPTGAPQSSVGVTPQIVSPPAPRTGTQKGGDGIWRGQSLSDIQNDQSIPKGARVRYKDGNGQIVEGVK